MQLIAYHLVTRRQARKFIFFQVATIIGPLASQICNLTHSSRSRFLPCLGGIVMTEAQPWKAHFPMWVTDWPKVMLARDVQSRKAPSPIWVTVSPKVLDREVQSRKAPSPIWVTFFLLHAAKVRSSCEEGPGQSAPQSAYHDPQLDKLNWNQQND